MISDDREEARWIAEVQRALDCWIADPQSVESTSQVLGTGAVRVAEQRFSALHRGRPALMTANATSGMLAALRCVGVRPGVEVLVPAIDWPGTVGVIRALGAVPVAVPVDPTTLTMSPLAVGRCVSDATVAVVVSHVLGIATDVDGVRKAVGPVPIIEDCAQALGSTIDGTPVGCLGDFAVFSFGPGKTIDVGEGGMVMARDMDLWEELVAEVAHPARQVLSGISEPNLLGVCTRPHPLAAVLLAEKLASWDPIPLRTRFAESVNRLPDRGFVALGCDHRRENASTAIPVWIEDGVSVEEIPGLNIDPCGLWQIDRLIEDGVSIEAEGWVICEEEPASLTISG